MSGAHVHEIAWEPSATGIELDLRQGDRGQLFDLRMDLVRELRDDMEEAAMLARGYEKVETFVEDLHDGMLMRVMGNTYEITNLLTHGQKQWCVQFVPHEYHEGFFELILPYDLQVTAYVSAG